MSAFDIALLIAAGLFGGAGNALAGGGTFFIDAILAERMVAAQASRQARLSIADDVVVNDGAIDELDAHVDALDRRYRKLAQLRG